MVVERKEDGADDIESSRVEFWSLAQASQATRPVDYFGPPPPLSLLAVSTPRTRLDLNRKGFRAKELH